MNNKQTFDISIPSVLKIVGVVLALYFLFYIRDILIMLFLSVIIAAAVDGPVDWLARHKIKRIFGTAIVYIAIFIFFGLFIYFVFPPLANQLIDLADKLPNYLNQLGASLDAFEQKTGFGLQEFLKKFSGQLSDATSDIFGTVVNVFGGLVNAFVIMAISIYLVAQDKSLKNILAGIIPEKYQIYTANLGEKIQNKLGNWLRGQILLMLIVGLIFFICLVLLRVKFALTLAILAGVFEIIPFIGPIAAGAVAFGIALTQSPFLALIVLVVFIGIQQLEGNVFTPLVMRKAVGLNPIIVIVALVVGGKLAGIVGMIIAVPLATVISILIRDFFALKNR